LLVSFFPIIVSPLKDPKKFEISGKSGNFINEIVAGDVKLWTRVQGKQAGIGNLFAFFFTKRKIAVVTTLW